jgi:hypothetical protein
MKAITRTKNAGASIRKSRGVCASKNDIDITRKEMYMKKNMRQSKNKLERIESPFTLTKEFL